MVELSNPTIVHGIVAGVTLILCDFLLHGLVWTGVVMNINALMVFGNVLFGIGAGIGVLFFILLIAMDVGI
jgi:hypothetical protein